MKSPPDLTFYSTAATIIPLFVLTLAFELRSRVFLPEFVLAEPDGSVKPGWLSLGLGCSLVALVVLAGGELAALHTLASRHATVAGRSATSTGLSLGGYLVYFSVTFRLTSAAPGKVSAVLLTVFGLSPALLAVGLSVFGVL